MEFHQFYLGCLAQAAYLVGSKGECAIVDPRRDVDDYIAEAERRGLKIRAVLLTHLHADFVSGQVELAARTGASIYISELAKVDYDHIGVADGDEIQIGGLKLRFLATPGHTPESMVVLVIDPEQSEEPIKALTGDTLFIGDAGRPDLVGSKGRSAEEMASCLYDSLQTKILTLPDAIEIWPGHGAGSACGRNMSTERWSTLAAQRVENVALRPQSKAEFVAQSTGGLAEPPAYFAHDVDLNRRGASQLAQLDALEELDADGVEARKREGALLLDVRSKEEFRAGHIPGSIQIGLDGKLASWAGTLIDVKQAIVLITTDAAQAAEARMRLARIGIENVTGMLAGGFEAWQQAGKQVAKLAVLTPQELAGRMERDGLRVLDVRGTGEFDGGHVPGAQLVPLPELQQRLSEVDLKQPLAVICASSYRSCIASSLLAAKPNAGLFDVVGGTAAWIEAGLPVEQPVA